jgi:hypothetical protein
MKKTAAAPNGQGHGRLRVSRLQHITSAAVRRKGRGASALFWRGIAKESPAAEWAPGFQIG